MFTDAKLAIANTGWESIVMPTSKTAHQVLVEKRCQELSKSAVEMLPKYETFFNEIYPNIDWEDEVPF